MPMVDQLACWQQESLPDGKIHKQPPRHTTLRYGADMAIRNERLLFMQVSYSYRFVNGKPKFISFKERHVLAAAPRLKETGFVISRSGIWY